MWAVGHLLLPRWGRWSLIRVTERGCMPCFSIAESAQGISPRAAHRSGLEPLDSSGSCHRAKAAAFRWQWAPLGEPIGPNQRRWPAPFTPAPLQSLHHYYEAVRPCSAHRYFRPRGWSRLRLFPWHRRPGSHVPYRSPVELRAAYTPDAARAVSGHPPSWSRRKGHPPVLTSPNPLSTLLQRFACARLSRPYLPGSLSRLFRDAHHPGFWPQQLTVAWDQRPDRRTRRDLLHLQYSYAAPFGPAMLVTQDPLLTCSGTARFRAVAVDGGANNSR